MPGSHQVRAKKLSLLELFGVLLWLLQAASPLAAYSYSKTLAAYLSYPPAALALIVLLYRIDAREEQILACLGSQNHVLMFFRGLLLLTAAVPVTLLGLVGGMAMKALAHFLFFEGMVLVWIVLAIAAYFGLQQGSIKDTIIFLAWFGLAHLTATLYPRMVETSTIYSLVMILCTYNYILTFDIF